jgi:DNA-binding response OmpR family regulator
MDTIKVLTIDDDVAVTELMQLLLASHGFSVNAANSGESGIDLIKTWEPDVVLLDLMMPGLDGWETCAKIRAFSSVPVIILSALDNPGFVSRALDAGADDFLVKPVPGNVLVAHIKKLVRRTASLKMGSVKGLPVSA